MTTITQNWSVTINVDGVDYTFNDPHPITNLMDQLANEQSNLALWQQRATDSQNSIADLQAKIKVLCTP